MEEVRDTTSPIAKWHRFDMGDGYEFASSLYSTEGWSVVASHGRDGWDAGHWPLIVIGCTTRANNRGQWVVVERVEGDCHYEAYPTREAMEYALDVLVEAHWRMDPEQYGTQIVEAVAEYALGELPEHFYGRSSAERLRKHQNETAVV